MLSPATIAELCRRQARIAARHKRVPLIVEAEDQQSGDRLAHHLRGIPNIGSHRPPGWTLVGTHFVDKSGLGARNEPALTFVQFLGVVQAGLGYAIIEEGVFQAVIGEFAVRRS
jgi:hypothetical protein